MSADVSVAAILLAAGLSRRAAPLNKLLHPMDGIPMVRLSAMAVLASRARPLIAVTGHQRGQVEAALAGLDLTCVDNPDFASGMAGSLRTGLAHVPAAAAGALICLGDMPEVRAATLDALIDACAPTAGDAIVVPVHGGRRGNPVLFGRSMFAELAAIDGDRGGKSVITRHQDRLVDVAVDDPGIHVDHDSPQASSTGDAEP